MKTPDQRGTFGAWLVQQRQRLSDERRVKVRQQDVVNELRAMGYPIDDAYYRALEGGSKRPGRDTRDALARFFGRQPPADVPPAGAENIGELATAIRQQTVTMQQLIELLSGGVTQAIERGIAEGVARYEAERQAREAGGGRDA